MNQFDYLKRLLSQNKFADLINEKLEVSDQVSCKTILELIASHEQLQSKLDKACAALEDICHDQHLIGLDHQMAIWMFNRASDALEEIRKKDDNG